MNQLVKKSQADQHSQILEEEIVMSSETELASLPKYNCLPQQPMEEAKDEAIAEDATAEEATKDTTVEKRKRREKIVTKGALVRDGYYICNSCDKPVCLENDKHRNIARAFRLFGHKNCVPVLKR